MTQGGKVRGFTRNDQRAAVTFSLAAGCVFCPLAPPAAAQSDIHSEPLVVNSSCEGGALLPHSATLDINLSCVKTANLSVAWGFADGGRSLASWAHSTPLGVLTGQSFTAVLKPLEAGQCYFYRVLSAAGEGEVWQADSQAFGTPPSWLKSVAHRGGALLAPENTIAAFRNAKGIADMVEFDVRVSKDGCLVVMHDETVNRTTYGTGSVSNMTLTQLKALDAGRKFSRKYAGERIPTLEEALSAILPDATPVVERKAGAAEDYASVIQSLDAARKVLVSCGDTTFLSQLHGLNPDIKLAAISSGGTLAGQAVSLKSKGIDFAFATNLQTGHIQRIHAAGLQAYAWTVNAPTQVQFYVASAVDGILSDDPLLVTQTARQDQDGDRLIDSWEAHYWGGLAASNGSADSDGDGFADAAEFQAGTDPRDPGSRLQLRPPEPDATGEITLGWSSQPGKFYSLLTAPFPTGPWVVLASRVPCAAPLNVMTVRTEEAQAFFRIRVDP